MSPGTPSWGCRCQQQATELARQMVTRWGMSEVLGPVSLSGRESAFLAGPEGYGGLTRAYSEDTARMVDAEVRRILQESSEEATRLLAAHMRELHALAAALLEQETLDEAEILGVAGLRRGGASEEQTAGLAPPREAGPALAAAVVADADVWSAEWQPEPGPELVGAGVRNEVRTEGKAS